jgi:2-(1,2-epoxy-1,2-dihydrophenyl)acetyl-CoA isomerase
MNDYNTLNFEIRNNIAYITLNRPKAANGLNSMMAKELSQVALYCDADSDIKVVVLTGSGRFFSAGGDVKEIASYGKNTATKLKALVENLHRAISTFTGMNAILIVAVNGIAAGAGFSLSMIGDIVFAAESASFTMAYTKAGLCPDGSASFFLPRLIGIRKTQELMLMNKTLTALEAFNWGMINRIVPDASLMDQVEQIAVELANGPSKANLAIKKMLLTTFGNSIETQMEIEAKYLVECAGSADGQEGIHAFIEKRKPNFS